MSIVAAQAFFVARGYWSDHKEFAFQMFPESSTWRAEVMRVTTDGQRVPISEPWSGYRWSDLVTARGLSSPDVRHHADAGLDNQLAFLDAALDWVAAHTPRRHRDAVPRSGRDHMAQHRRPRGGRAAQR